MPQASDYWKEIGWSQYKKNEIKWIRSRRNNFREQYWPEAKPKPIHMSLNMPIRIQKRGNIYQNIEMIMLQIIRIWAAAYR